MADRSGERRTVYSAIPSLEPPIPLDLDVDRVGRAAVEGIDFGDQVDDAGGLPVGFAAISPPLPFPYCAVKVTAAAPNVGE